MRGFGLQLEGWLLDGEQPLTRDTKAIYSLRAYGDNGGIDGYQNSDREA